MSVLGRLEVVLLLDCIDKPQPQPHPYTIREFRQVTLRPTEQALYLLAPGIGLFTDMEKDSIGLVATGAMQKTQTRIGQFYDAARKPALALISTWGHNTMANLDGSSPQFRE